MTATIAPTNGLVRDVNGYGWWENHNARGVPSRSVFYERGARMTDGGTAWLIWVRVTADEVEIDGHFVGLQLPGEPFTSTVRAFKYGDGYEHAYDNAWEVGARYPGVFWHAHLADAGSLDEARESARIILERLRKG